MVLYSLVMFSLLVLAVLLSAMLIHRLNRKIPSLYEQRQRGEAIISMRVVNDATTVKKNLKDYFIGIKYDINIAILINMCLSVVVFLMFLCFLNYIPLPSPKPGPLIVSRMSVTIFLTFVATSFSWLKMVMLNLETRELEGQLIDKCIILGFFKPDED